jgi:hypothetical protein
MLTHVADRILSAARSDRLSLKNPPKTVDEYLERLTKAHLPQFVALVRPHADRLAD